MAIISVHLSTYRTIKKLLFILSISRLSGFQQHLFTQPQSSAASENSLHKHSTARAGEGVPLQQIPVQTQEDWNSSIFRPYGKTSNNKETILITCRISNTYVKCSEGKILKYDAWFANSSCGRFGGSDSLTNKII